MNRLTSIAIFLSIALVSGCDNGKDANDLLTMDDSQVHRDRDRYASMSFRTISYVDYDVYGTYLLPINKSSLEHAIYAPSVQPSRTPEKWGGTATGNSFYWDRNWTTPRQYRVWWFRVVDAEVFGKDYSYDKYTMRATEPGAAWCEAVISIDKPPPAEAGNFVLHLYPDGHVEGYLSGLKEFDAETPRFTAADRNKLPSLQGKPCLKEIPNPYYGMKKPIQMN